MKKKLCLFALALGMLPVQAQDNNEFTVDVQLRPRAEYRAGQGALRGDDSQAAAFVSNRARLSLGFKSQLLDLKVAGQHVGTWGAEGQTKSNGDFTMNEAWAKLHSADGAFYALFGRQALIYDDERILGGLDWAQTGRYHDGLKLGYEKNEDKLNVILALNQNKENRLGTYYDASTGQPYKSMQTAWYHHQFTDAKFGASFLFMNLGWEAGDASKGDSRYMQTFGTHLTFAPSTFNFAGCFYYQTGKEAKGRKVGAYTWSLNATDRISPIVSVNAGVDFRSGDDGTSGTYRAFDQLWGTHHKFYGTMDYFLQKVECGLWDPHASATFTLAKPVTLSATYHYFLADKKFETPDCNKRSLGSEIDLQLNWKAMENVTLQCGISTMIANEAMEAYCKGDHKKFQGWGWLSLNINPTIFASKK